MAFFRASCVIDGPVEHVWDVLCDWEATRHWMVPPTTVEVMGEQRTGVGARLHAVTTIGRVFRLTDQMVVTDWIEHREIRTRHVGWMLRGDGIFRLHADGERTRFEWIEDLPLPLGVVGELVGLLLRPLVERLMRRGCARLGAFVGAR